jgi:hypothetical protein
MDLTQAITLELTGAECRQYVIELGELEGIADQLSPGGLNTETGLTVLHRLRDIIEKHGLGIRQAVLETEVAYLKNAWTPQYPPYQAPPGVQAVPQEYPPQRTA